MVVQALFEVWGFEGLLGSWAVWVLWPSLLASPRPVGGVGWVVDLDWLGLGASFFPVVS